MTRSLAIIGLICTASALYPMRVAAESTTPMPPMPMPPMHGMAMHMPPQISVAASGTAEYVPDTARITLGIRAESASAATAIDTINKNTAQVIAAVKGLGINESAVKTIGYNLQYRERPSIGQPQPAIAPAGGGTPGNYEASEMLQVSTPVAVAGKVLDAAISAGANESFGLSYQTSNYDSLYRAALARAMKSARDSADALAKAAHVTIVQIQSISNSSEQQPSFATMRAPMAMNSASVMPGTDAVTATVYVVYAIK